MNNWVDFARSLVELQTGIIRDLLRIAGAEELPRDIRLDASALAGRLNSGSKGLEGLRDQLDDLAGSSGDKTEAGGGEEDGK